VSGLTRAIPRLGAAVWFTYPFTGQIMRLGDRRTRSAATVDSHAPRGRAAVDGSDLEV